VPNQRASGKLEHHQMGTDPVKTLDDSYPATGRVK
jgi:hypothetical protein